MEPREKRIKVGEVFLSIGCVLLVAFQLFQYFSSNCVVAFGNLPEICGKNVKYLLSGLVILELLYPTLIMRRFFKRLTSRRSE